VGVSSCGGNVEGGGRERTTWPVLPARTAVVIVVDLLCRRCGVCDLSPAYLVVLVILGAARV
jgi:hypothetical protein